MHTIRHGASVLGPEFAPRVYSGYFFTIEPLSMILKTTLQNFVLIVFVVSVICIVVLANVKVALLVVSAVVTIELILVGALPYYSLDFNMMTSINLIVAVGLCVDFSAHMAHAFLHSPSTGGHARAVDAFDKVGLSIWNGAFSTFLSLLPMTFCQSYIALLFFKMTSTVIVLGIFFGLCVVPICLVSLDGTDSYEDVFPEQSKMVMNSASGKEKGRGKKDLAKAAGVGVSEKDVEMSEIGEKDPTCSRNAFSME